MQTLVVVLGISIQTLLRYLQDQIKKASLLRYAAMNTRANIIVVVEDRIDLNAISITVAFEIVNDSLQQLY